MARSPAWCGGSSEILNVPRGTFILGQPAQRPSQGTLVARNVPRGTLNDTDLGLSALLPYPYGTISVFLLFGETPSNPCQPHIP